MSNCNLYWLFITMSFTKSKQTKTRQHPHTCFMLNLSPPFLVPVGCGHTKAKMWLSTPVCQFLLHLPSVTRGWTTLDLIPLSPPPPCHVLKHSSSQGCENWADRGPRGWEPTTLSVVKLRGANTEKFGPKSSSQVCLLDKGPLQPLLPQDTAEVL